MIGGLTGLLGCTMSLVLISPGFLFMAAANLPAIAAWFQHAPPSPTTCP